MSYCRWSSDNFRCDLYVYESVYGCWTIHVAGSRYPDDTPPAPSLISLARGEMTQEEYSAKRAERDAFMAKHDMVPIALPHDGETFNVPSPGDAADKIEQLIALGYNCPEGVVSTLREEQEELDVQAVPVRKDAPHPNQDTPHE